MRSMTGFGRAHVEDGGVRVDAEVRSINQRFLEIKLSLPRGWGAHEGEIRRLVQGAVARGRVEVLIRRSSTRPASVRLMVNHELAAQYGKELRRLGRELGLDGKPGIEAILQRPEIFQVIEREQDERAEVRIAADALERALKALRAEREREGRSLKRDIAARLKRVDAARREMVKLAASSRAETMANFRRRMAEILGELPIDERRLYEDASNLAQRADVSEELTRLEAHLEGMRELFQRRDAVGKPIEFLLQELSREVNTVASKSQDAALSRVAVEAKSELEKIREQVQNVE